jgi:molecular chaperone HtpG
MTEPAIERIPFEVDVSRIIEVLAKQIYQTPLALLRENAQNAFDAILLRRHRLGSYDARIDITITESEITIVDNGIGMSPDDLRTHYWHAGSSGKNTPEARAAGVVGTFGIGAMANFGIADELFIETESASSGERTRSSARRDTLSATEECIELASVPARGEPGTTVRANLEAGTVNVAEATSYISEFVSLITVPVFVNGAQISGRSAVTEVPAPEESHEHSLEAIETRLSGDVAMRVNRAGEVWVQLRDLQYQGSPVGGEIVLRQGRSAIRTFRSGFGLAVAGVSSVYGFGGIADVGVLEPTAGREALTTESLQVLQETITALDQSVSVALGGLPESNQNTAFMQWVRMHGRYDLCDHLIPRIEPGPSEQTLVELKDRSDASPVRVYAGSDVAMISSIATDDSPLVILASSNPRRQCEQEYLTRYCNVDELTDAPTVLSQKPAVSWTLAEQAFCFRIASILETDYFLTAEIELGELSHGVPILALTEDRPIRLVLDPSGASFGVITQLYDSDYAMFGSMVKDYVRNMVFPRVADFVPSSTRQGAEAFLKSIQRTRDVFEYEAQDLESFSRIWEEYLAGSISMGEAAQRSIHVVQQTVQVIEPAATGRVTEVVPDVAENQPQEATEQPAGGPAPPILRTEVETAAKLLTVSEGENPLYGYRCFITLSDRAREERGEFFLQPHSTSVVWGGQKVLFVFEHHSGEFGVYYDLQAAHVVSPESGGGLFPTATIVLREKIFIPVPDALADTFIPTGDERKRFEVRCDLLYTDVSGHDLTG